MSLLASTGISRRACSAIEASLLCPRCRRQISTSSAFFSGHSRWSTIKHDKGRADLIKGKQRNLIAKAIADASKLHGADPATNPQLADAVAKAKRTGFPKAGIESAIARGQGKSADGVKLETVMLEAVVPPVAVIVECETDSKARALQELRLILKNAGAQPTATEYLFEKRGRIAFHSKDGIGMEDMLETALEAGAIDVVESEEGRLVVDTQPAALKSTEKALMDAHGLEPASSETIWVPNPDTVIREVEPNPMSQLCKLQEELHDYPGIQGVYMNADV